MEEPVHQETRVTDNQELTPLPFVGAALLCERVLREQDEVVSVIRIIDQLGLRVSGGPPELLAEARPETTIQGFLAFRPTVQQGSWMLRLDQVRPSGDRNRGAEASIPFNFTADEMSLQVVIDLTLIITGEGGLYWFEVFLDDRLVTRMPLRVTVVREMETGEERGPALP